MALVATLVIGVIPSTVADIADGATFAFLPGR
jgi:hypothetical protein